MTRALDRAYPLRIVRSSHGWRKLPYTVIQLFGPDSPFYPTKGGCEAEIYKAYSAIGALRQTRLIPGAKVKVWVPAIVHARRVHAARKLYKSIYKAIPQGPTLSWIQDASALDGITWTSEKRNKRAL